MILKIYVRHSLKHFLHTIPSSIDTMIRSSIIKYTVLGGIILMLPLFNDCLAQKNKNLDKIYHVKWLRSMEEDEHEIRVYRPESYNFPPSRGRTGFRLNDDKTFINYEIAPTDGILERLGIWERLGDKHLGIIFEDSKRNFQIEIISLTKDNLKIRIKNY
ncbi:hypothetical protein QQ008_05525 [Fulvivirgaceae bacterium BMA10]|uniref:Uncharacterized protein n=1 Tax=Splendidivirga corallicola TaxID=3051826 RepID=A0ABT8KJD6_9BACT|nr:hypothetical protein [Fulvivirgaceae bacterium BMA10]